MAEAVPVQSHGAPAQGHQEHPIGLYLAVWILLFVLSGMSYAVDYFHLQGMLRWTLIIIFMLLKAGLIVAVFMPPAKSTPLTICLGHQSQITLPGLIHDESARAHGGLQLKTIWLSIRSPGRRPSMMTRQGVMKGVLRSTAGA